MSMPSILEAIQKANLTGREKEIADQLVGRNGLLRSTKPKNDGEAMYVWRMVAFQISPHPQHHCMPVAAVFDVDIRDEKGKWSSALVRVRTKELDVLVDKIVNQVPKHEWHGVMNWAGALF